jgi:putative membrane protein insertion efficiency factor
VKTVPGSKFQVPPARELSSPRAKSPEHLEPGTSNLEQRPLFPVPRTVWQWLQAPLTWTVIALIRLYQLGISPGLPSSCRFAPSCSQYTLEAIQRHHALKGILLGTWRLLRCHPWHPGGYDPVP